MKKEEKLKRDIAGEYDDYKGILADRFNMLRFESDAKSFVKLAEEMGLSRATLSRIENGYNVNMDTLKIVADYYQVTTDYLLGNTDNKNEDAKISQLGLSDSAIYFLRRDKQLGRIIALLLENQGFRDTIKNIDDAFSNGAELGYDFSKKVYNNAADALEESKPDTLDADRVIEMLRKKATSVERDQIREYLPGFEQALLDIMKMYNTDPINREKILLIQGAFDATSDEIKKSVNRGKRLSKKEAVDKYVEYLMKTRVFGDNEKTYRKFTEVVIEVAEQKK